MDPRNSKDAISPEVDPTKIDFSAAFAQEAKPIDNSPVPELRYDHGFGKNHDDLRIPLLLGSLVIVTVVSFLFYRASKVKPIKPLVLLPTPIAKQTVGSPSTIPTGVLNATDSADLPPLYPGIEWENAVQEKVLFHDENFNVIDLDGTSVISNPLDNYPFAFIEYYKNELEKMGWKQTSVAGAPDIDGGFYEYKKSNKYFLFGVRKNVDDQEGRALIQYTN